jgi:branched-chain amino acid transport system ATP-binding protein
MTSATAEPAVTAAGPALHLRDIRAGYDGLEVLHGVDLQVPPTGVVALLGPNGAGKSTVLKVASGRLKPMSGSVEFHAAPITGRSPEQLARLGLCTVPEGRGVFPSLTVKEHLRMWTFRGAGLSTSAVADRTFEQFPQLAKRAGQQAGTLSGGEQQMLAMSRALVGQPEVLLLDEISMGLAPKVVEELYVIVASLAASGLAILLVEQFARTAMSVATTVALMAGGEIRASGPPEEMSELATEIYLTGSAAVLSAESLPAAKPTRRRTPKPRTPSP